VTRLPPHPSPRPNRSVREFTARGNRSAGRTYACTIARNNSTDPNLVACLDIERLFEYGFSVAQSTVGVNRDGPVQGPDAEER